MVNKKKVTAVKKGLPFKMILTLVVVTQPWGKLNYKALVHGNGILLERLDQIKKKELWGGGVPQGASLTLWESNLSFSLPYFVEIFSHFIESP